MKKFLIKLLALMQVAITITGFYSCLDEEEANCTQFQGSPIEQFMMQNGASDLGDALEEQIETDGALIRIIHANSMGSDRSHLGGSYSDSSITTILPGIVKIDNKTLSIMQNNSPFKINILDTTLFSLFDGGIHNLIQYERNSTNAINTTNVQLPLAFNIGSNKSTVDIDSFSNVNIAWPVLNAGEYVYIVAYASHEMGNDSITENYPFYFVKRVSDTGRYQLTPADFTNLPVGSRYMLYLVRYKYKLFSDSRNSERSNLFLGLSTSVAILRK